MFRKLRKFVLAAAMIGGGVALLLGTVAGRHVQLAADDVAQLIDANVPLDRKIRVVEKMLKEIDGKVAKADRDVAREQVALEKLRGEVAVGRHELAVKLTRVQALKGEVTTALAARSDRAVTKSERLNHEWAAYKLLKDQLAANEKTLTARETQFEAANLKVVNLRHAKEKLKLQVESLKATHRMQEAQRVAVTVQVNDQELGQVKKLIGEIEDKLRENAIVEERQQAGTQPAVTTPPADVLKEIEAETKKAKPTNLGGESL